MFLNRATIQTRADDKDEFDAHRDAFAYLETPKSFDESARDESVDIRRHEAILDHILKVEEAEEKMTEEKRKEDDDERDLLPSSVSIVVEEEERRRIEEQCTRAASIGQSLRGLAS